MTSPPFLKSLRWHVKKLTLYVTQMDYSCKEEKVRQLKCEDGVCFKRGRETEFSPIVSAFPGSLHSGLNLPLVYSEKDTGQLSVTEDARFHHTHFLFFLVFS